MSGGGGGRKAAGLSGEDAEVEALLRAAQDAVLLKLQANSHLVSSASASAPTAPPLDGAAAADPLDDDLARRFDALRSRAAAPPKPKPAGAGAAAPPASTGGMEELEARFAALKGGAAAGPEARVSLEDLGGESSEDEEDEVEKVMRWARDAARLDVATAGAGAKAKRVDTDEEEEKDEKSSVSSEDDDDEDEKLQREMARRKEMAKSKSKSKWFFL